MGCVVKDVLSHLGTAVAIGAVIVACASSCATPAAAPPTAPLAGASTPPAVSSPPEWRPGDRWVYGWTSGADSGTKVVEVLQTQEINKVPYYVIRIGDIEHFWTHELQWAGTMREQKVESRMSPPEPWFAWPLEAGRRWSHRATYEDSNGKSQLNDRFSVIAPEVVEVPAGRFSAVKVVRETDRRDSDEYWYAPEVRFYVKWVGRRGDTQFEERLREYHSSPKLIPGSLPSAAPSPTR